MLSFSDLISETVRIRFLQKMVIFVSKKEHFATIVCIPLTNDRNFNNDFKVRGDYLDPSSSTDIDRIDSRSSIFLCNLIL